MKRLLTEELLDSGTSAGNPEFALYKWRWYILATLSILNMSNALQWLAFAPVAYDVVDFYNTSIGTVNMFSATYMIACIPCGVVASWLLDTFGLRASLIAGAWLNFVGSAIRIVSALGGVSAAARVPLAFFGTVLAALAQPFILFAPTKLAALWFPNDQRAVANMVATMCNPLGIMLAGILSPVLVESDGILFMLIIESIPGFLAVAMATFGVCRSEPPTPPSASAETPSEPFLVGVKALLKNKAYWLLAWAVGGGIALFSVLTTMLFQMLCPWGYSDNFAGIVCTASLIGAGLCGGLATGLIVDRNKRYIEVTKICFIIAVLGLTAFATMHNHAGLWVPIAVSLGVFGFFGLPVYPIGNELSVETTYPVGEATSSGVLFMFGQVQGVLLVIVLGAIGTDMSSDQLVHSKCNENGDESVKVKDMTVPTYVMAGYGIVVMLVFVLVFRSKYRRLEAENSRRAGEESPNNENSSYPVHNSDVRISDESQDAENLLS